MKHLTLGIAEPVEESVLGVADLGHQRLHRCHHHRDILLDICRNMGGLHRPRHIPEAWIGQNPSRYGHRAVLSAVVLEACVENAINSDAAVDDLPDFSVRFSDLDEAVTVLNQRDHLLGHVRCRPPNAAPHNSRQCGARKAKGDG